MSFETFDNIIVEGFLDFDASGRVRWHYRDDAGLVLVVPEPPVSAEAVRNFILASSDSLAGFDPGWFESDAEAMRFSVVNR
jgi:hypothetical protein